MKIIRNRFVPFRGYSAINLFGMLFCKPDVYISQRLINHERIHTAQMLEMLVIFFYLWYFIEWIIKIITPGRAYYRISFEREAYLHEHDLNYLKHRPLFAWWKYIWLKKKKKNK